MKDRVPTYPGRVQLTPVPGQANTYDMVRADEPTEPGSAINKANLLPDDVAAALGLTGNPQVKDALEKIKALIDGNTALADSKAKIATGSYTGTGTFGSGNKNSLALGFVPKLVFISVADPYSLVDTSGRLRDDTQFFVYGQTRVTTADQPSYYSYPTWANPFTWYHNTAANWQMNVSGKVYYYVAIG